MVRFLVSCFFYVAVARWGYAEVALSFPSALPTINGALQVFQIPTHDRWSRGAIHTFIDRAGDYLSKAEEALDTVNESLAQRHPDSANS